MTATTASPTVRTAEGLVSGRWEDAVAAFRGTPYAQPPVGSHRWAPPERFEPWAGARPAHVAGPIPPQHPARLQAAMGPMRAPAVGEDCLNLNVWTPAPG